MEVMYTYKKNGCRERGILSNISYKLLSFQNYHKLLQSTISTLLLLPALFSCDTTEYEKENTRTMVRTSGIGPASETLDIFSFSLEGAGYLDSYQHYEHISTKDIELRSQNGNKHVFICANGQKSTYDWAAVNSMESLNKMFIELKDERRESLCATGEGTISAGSGIQYDVEMRRMACEIVLNSIRCDFRGKGYEGMDITDPKVYLTNVNCRCSLTADGDILPLSIINPGKADPEDMAGMAEPDMIYQKLNNDIDNDTRHAGLSFICYPNASSKESPGTPFTRMVIEGKIDGETYWWPIDINRGKGTDRPGIHRNTRYIMDIKITRKGSASPDIAIEADVAEVMMSIRPWEEKGEQRVSF